MICTILLLRSLIRILPSLVQLSLIFPDFFSCRVTYASEGREREGKGGKGGKGREGEGKCLKGREREGGRE